MKTFYVSLTRDLIGCYLELQAESERAVRLYLEHEYLDKKSGVWKLPWCAVYEVVPVQRTSVPPVIIRTNYSNPLYEADFQ